MKDFLPSIAALLHQRAVNDSDSLAFAFRDESLTYRQLFDESERIAELLHHDGVGAGDRVAIVMPAGLDLIRAFYAAQRLGAIPCIFDHHVPEETTRRRIAAIRPRRVITELPVAGSGRALPPRRDDENAIAFLQSTSGTSGDPLAAIVLQRHVMASMRSSLDLLDPGPNDVLVGWVPPWHDLGLLRFVIGPLYYGVPCHIISPAVKTIPEWFAKISAVMGTITGAPDFAWRLATRLVDPARVDLSSVRFATNGGEPVRASTIEAFERRFGLSRVVRPGYGLAEATLGVTSVRSGDALRSNERGDVSCGKALKDVEVRIEEGEIVVRGPAVFAGYFEAEDATTRALRDGWLYTGDAGRIDDDGNVYVVGRLRALIKRGGATLAPREFEEAAQSVTGVRVAAAVGVPGELTEEIVVAVEVDPVERGLLAREYEVLVASAVERALGFAPDRVLVLEPRAIPRTSNGKIRHAVLRDQLSPSSLRSNPSVSSDGDSRR